MTEGELKHNPPREPDSLKLVWTRKGWIFTKITVRTVRAVRGKKNQFLDRGESETARKNPF